MGESLEAVVESVLACAATVGAWRVVRLPASRRELREHPVMAAALVLGGTTLGGFAIMAARASPTVLRALAVGLVGLWASLAWRARPAYGLHRGFPPGSLGLGHSVTALADPGIYRREALRWGPVFKMAEFHRPVVCVVGLELARRILRDHGDALRPTIVPTLHKAVPRGFLRYMTPEDHAAYAPPLRASIADALVPRFEAVARDAIREALEELVHSSSATPQSGVDLRPVLDRALWQILLQLYFGAMLRASDAVRIEAWLRDADRRTLRVYAAPRAQRALRDFMTLLGSRAAGTNVDGNDSIWAGLARRDPTLVVDPTVIGNLFHNLRDSRTNLLDLLVAIGWRLGHAHGWVAQVRAQPSARDGGHDPATRAVRETLRLADEYVYREVLRPIRIDGFRIPRGWRLRVCIVESHLLDPRVDRPEAFDPDRRIDPEATAPFGLDRHACIAAPLSLLLGGLFATELLERFDCRIAVDAPLARANRHFALWQPSDALRVTIRRRERSPE